MRVPINRRSKEPTGLRGLASDQQVGAECIDGAWRRRLSSQQFAPREYVAGIVWSPCARCARNANGVMGHAPVDGRAEA